MRHLWIIPGLLFGFYRAHEIPGLFVFLLIEEAGVPLLIPGDVLIIAAGARHNLPLTGAVLVILTASVAATLGSSLLYTLMRRGGRSRLLRRLPIHRGDNGHIATVERWFRQHGAVAIVIGRLVPGVRTPTTIMAGLVGIPYRTFAPATAIAAMLWALFYFFLGMVLQQQSRHLIALFTGDLDDLVSLPVLAIVLAVGLGGVAGWQRLRRTAPAAGHSAPTVVPDE